jgi:macrodomain Ter protein organizer (MatP/YcbG family)
MTSVVTDKKRVSLYIEETLKVELEKLAKARKRSLSNLIEVLCEEAVQQAKKQGEISSLVQDKEQGKND